MTSSDPCLTYTELTLLLEHQKSNKFQHNNDHVFLFKAIGFHESISFFQYGGDISRKMKLLKRQAEGKKRMRMIGRIEVPKDTFINVLKK